VPPILKVICSVRLEFLDSPEAILAQDCEHVVKESCRPVEGSASNEYRLEVRSEMW
jgi:hypothetical protein